MQLTFEQLTEFAVGIESSEVMDGAWHAHRLPEQLGRVYDDPPRFAVRRECPSSVRLRFITNSTRIDAALRLGSEADPFFQGALVVDSAEPVAFGPAAACPQWEGNVFTKADRAARLIDLWLPHLCVVDVKSIRLDEGSEVRAAPPLPLRWLAYGDSITQGFCASLPTLNGVSRCARELKAALHNLGVGGSVLHPELAETLPRASYDLITIAYGACDFQVDVPLDSFQNNAQRLIDALHTHQPRCPIVVLTPILPEKDPGKNKIGLTFQDYRDALRTKCAAHPAVTVVAGETLVPADLVNFQDWVHPNDRGFELYARNLLPHLQRALATAAAHK